MIPLDPDDQCPQTAPLVYREPADARERQVFTVHYGVKGMPFTSQLIVRRHPGTEDVTLALTPTKGTPPCSDDSSPK